MHPCDKKTKGGCEQECVKNATSYHCKCQTPQFKLSEDKKSCVKGKRQRLRTSYLGGPMYDLTLSHPNVYSIQSMCATKGRTEDVTTNVPRKELRLSVPVIKDSN